MLERLDPHTVPYFYAAVLFFAASIITFFWNKKWGIRLLIVASGILGYFMAILDPFLNLWDEQQHALVAKHMAENPFKPMLYKTPLIEYDYKSWISNHVWIHKQPLFLWQMAFFIKILGAKVIAVRLPSVILHALLPYLVYRIGSAMKNETAGFIAAIFICIAHYPLEMVAGRYPTDHNDVSFLFYVTWSVMCWVEFQRTKDKKWLIWLGISAGCAVLVKWLMGLLVYVCWFLTISVLNKFKVWQIKNYYVMIKPFLISLLIFLPWQIYCFIRFPNEAAHEMGASASHFSKVVEGHVGTWDYHIETAFHALYFKDTYLFAAWMPLFVAFLIAIGIWRMKSNVYRAFSAIMIVFIYLFFSIAATKMLAFTVIAMPMVFVGMAAAFEYIRELIGQFVKSKIVQYGFIVALLVSPCWQLLKLDIITKKHSLAYPEVNDMRQAELDELAFAEYLNDRYQDDKVVIFNANITPVGFIPLMFSTDYVVYGHQPNEEQINAVAEKGYHIVILDRNDLQAHLISDKRVELLDVAKIIETEFR